MFQGKPLAYETKKPVALMTTVHERSQSGLANLEMSIVIITAFYGRKQRGEYDGWRISVINVMR